MTPVALFVYGTLMRPELLRAVTGHSYATEPAILANHARWRIWDEYYPALVFAPGESASGQLLEGVGATALAALDRFEGALYERRPVTVHVASGMARAAQTYRWIPQHWHRLRREPWPLPPSSARAAQLAAIPHTRSRLF